MLKAYKEADFAALRGPLESGRQSPSNLAFAMILCFFLQPLLFFLANYVAGDETNLPYAFKIKIVHMVLTAVLMVMCIVFVIPKIYVEYERAQYLVSILVSQNLFMIFGFLERNELEQNTPMFVEFKSTYGGVPYVEMSLGYK